MYTNYDGLVDFVLTNGKQIGPRGKMTTEIVGATITVPSNIFIRRHGGNTRLIEIETFMLLGGFFNLEIFPFVTSARSVELLSKQSDYGPRVMREGNWSRAITEILKDTHTRRAVVYFNEPAQESSDLACTTSMQFLVRNNHIHGIVSMRSWDVVYGLPADLFMFSNLLQAMGRITRGFPCGNLTVQVGSLHMYEDTEHIAVQKEICEFSTDFFAKSCGDPNFFKKAVDELALREATIDTYWTFKPMSTTFAPIHIGGI
jgi:hypothetical protein